MTQNQIKDLPRLRTENMENIFNVYIDKNKQYFYNLLQTIALPSNLPKTYFDTYTATYQDTWPLISYKTLKTPNLWWLLLITNNIINPVQQPSIGTTIKIPKDFLVTTILTQINSTNNE